MGRYETIAENCTMNVCFLHKNPRSSVRCYRAEILSLFRLIFKQKCRNNRLFSGINIFQLFAATSFPIWKFHYSDRKWRHADKRHCCCQNCGFRPDVMFFDVSPTWLVPRRVFHYMLVISKMKIGDRISFYGFFKIILFTVRSCQALHRVDFGKTQRSSVLQLQMLLLYIMSGYPAYPILAFASLTRVVRYETRSILERSEEPWQTWEGSEGRRWIDVGCTKSFPILRQAIVIHSFAKRNEWNSCTREFFFSKYYGIKFCSLGSSLQCTWSFGYFWIERLARIYLLSKNTCPLTHQVVEFHSTESAPDEASVFH